MADADIEFLTVLWHYFKLGLKANAAVFRIREMKGNETIYDHLAQNWLQHFKDVVLSLKLKLRTGQTSVLYYSCLKTQWKRESDQKLWKNFGWCSIIKRYKKIEIKKKKKSFQSFWYMSNKIWFKIHQYKSFLRDVQFWGKFIFEYEEEIYFLTFFFILNC